MNALQDTRIVRLVRRVALLMISTIMSLSPLAPILAAEQIPNMADQAVKTKVEALLRADNRIDWKLLEVQAKDGHVTLMGGVLTEAEKGLAENLASAVPGVEGITNSILVADPKTPELKLKKDVYEALLSTPAVREHAALKINVEGAVVKLRGIATDRATQEAAIRGAKSVSGVKDVINEVQIGKVQHKHLELEGVGRIGKDGDNKEIFVP